MVYHDIILYVYYIVYDITNDMVYHEIMSYICVLKELEESGVNVQDDRDWNLFWAQAPG